MDEFYCWECRRHKPMGLAVNNPSGRRLRCKSCDEKVARIAKKTDAQRERKRMRVTKLGSDHLMPNVSKEVAIVDADIAQILADMTANDGLANT